MGFAIPGVLRREDPTSGELPLVFDSPHSGSEYPSDFGFACDFSVLRSAEDAYVDELYRTAPAAGATLIAAAFPRSYLDPNRATDDLDAALIDGAWPYPLNPSHKTRAGLGVVRRVARPGVPIYDRKLAVAEVLARLERCHSPYHRTLDEACDRLHRKFGAVWHINCHSMPSPSDRLRQADFILGDRDGTTCAPQFTRAAAEFLKSRGYRVFVNEIYKGVEIVRRQGRPRENRHSLQIEVDRALYMNQKTRRRHDGFARLSEDIGRLVAALALFVAAQLDTH
jgi:N-formylglutamate amidohydrolase